MQHSIYDELTTWFRKKTLENMVARLAFNSLSDTSLLLNRKTLECIRVMNTQMLPGVVNGKTAQD